MNTFTGNRPIHGWMTRGVPAVLLAVVLLAWALPAAAAEPAGRVISLVGTVRVIDADGASRTLARGDAIHAGDTLTLGPRAHAQVRMRDDALIELEAGARFTIPVYSESADGASAVMRLLRGAMRTITGTVGDGPDETYQMDTPVATIGIRGTEYALHYCIGDCPDDNRDAGLYGRVDAGAVEVRNQAAQRVFRERQYFYVAAQDAAPREIVRPPAGILDGGAVSGGALRPGSDVDTGLDSDLDTTVDGLSTTLGNTVDSTGALLGDTVDGTVELTGDTLSGTGELAGDTLGDTLDGDLDVGQTLGDTVDLGGDTLSDTTDLADDTLDGAADSLDTTVDDTTNTINDLLDGDGQ